MKKSIRITSLLLALLMLALPLVGCDRIDEMRANQGFWNDAGSISFNGQTYKLLSRSRYIHIEWYPSRTLQITSKGVPLLLSEKYGSDFRISYDETFIKSTSSGNIYCRADQYDHVEQCIKDRVKRDYLGFYYKPTEENKDIVGHVLTEEEEAAIETILASKPVGNTRDMRYTFSTVAWLYHCTEDMLFSVKSDIHLYLNSEDCRFMANGNVLYSVPEEYDELFDNMFEEFRRVNPRLFQEHISYPLSDDI